MRPAAFTTDVLPLEERVATFQRSTIHFAVEPLGEPEEFHVSWKMVTLGDVHLLHTFTSPLRYTRSRELIEQDGEERLAIHLRLDGTAHGHMNGIESSTSPGEAIIWDLSYPLEQYCTEASEIMIVTAPRIMLADFLNGLIPKRPVGGVSLRLAQRYLSFLLDHAGSLGDASAQRNARALCQIFAAAFLPETDRHSGETSPIFTRRRVEEIIDNDLARNWNMSALASAIATDVSSIAAIVGGAHGLRKLINQRRLILAYRMLLDMEKFKEVGFIAFKCGFSSQQALSRKFHSVFNVTPTGLREQATGRLPNWAGSFDIDRLFDPLAIR